MSNQQRPPITGFLLFLIAVSLILMAAITEGCRHNLDTTNPVVVNAATLADAEKSVNTIAHGLLAADQTLDQIKAAEPDYYASVEPKLKSLARVNEVANQCIVTNLNGGACDWKAAVIAIAQEAGKPENLTSFGFKNSDTQKKVQVGFAALTTGINLAIQFQQKNGG